MPSGFDWVLQLFSGPPPTRTRDPQAPVTWTGGKPFVPTPEQEAEMSRSNWQLTGGALSTLAGLATGGIPGGVTGIFGMLDKSDPSVLTSAGSSRRIVLPSEALFRGRRPLPVSRPTAPANQYASGFIAKPDGTIITLEEMASHLNAPEFKEGLAAALKKGYVRGRESGGLEIHSIEAVDPNVMRESLRIASRGRPDVYVDTTLGSSRYRTKDLADADFEIGLVKPVEFWRKE